MTGGQPIASLTETNANQAAGSGALSRMEFSIPGHSINFGIAGSTNASINGSLPGDMTVRASTRIIFGDGTAQAGYWDMDLAVHRLVFLNSTILTSNAVTVIGNITNTGNFILSGNLTGSGTDSTLNNQTLTGSGSILTQGLADARYASGWTFIPVNSDSASTSGGPMVRSKSELASSGVKVQQFDDVTEGAPISPTSFWPDYCVGKTVEVSHYYSIATSTSLTQVIRFRQDISYVTNNISVPDGIQQTGVYAANTFEYTIPQLPAHTYKWVITNSIPANAVAISTIHSREANNPADTFTSTAWLHNVTYRILNQ